MLKRTTRLAQGVAAASLLLTANVQAMEFEFKDSDLRIDWDTSIKYGVMWRVQNPDPNHKDLPRTYNVDDGTNNFDKGVVSNRITVVSEADINHGNYGIFLRAKGLYDYRYEEQNTDQTDETYFSDNSGDGGGAWTTDIGELPLGGSVGDVDQNDFHPDTKDQHGKDIFFLDYFAYGEFELGSKLFAGRVGNQVISWGEAFFFPNTAGAQSHADADAAASPGTQVKEIFLPSGAIYGNLEVTENISIEAYYQYEWERTKQAAVGSYWSNADVSGNGAERFLLYQDVVPQLGGISLTVPVDVVRGQEPDGGTDDDQYGLAMRYFFEGGTELGFFYVRYHDKIPNVLGLTNPDPAAPQLAPFPVALQDYYHEDIDLFSMSFSTLVGGINMVGELSYTVDAAPTQRIIPAEVSDGMYATAEIEEADVIQANIGLFQIWGSNPISDGITLFSEAVFIHKDTGQSDVAEGVDMLNDNNAYGYSFTLDFDYKSVYSGLDLTVKTAFKHSIDGDWKGVQLTDDTFEASVGVAAKYLENWKGDIKYSNFWGSDDQFDKHDRDNISLSVTYSF